MPPTWRKQEEGAHPRTPPCLGSAAVTEEIIPGFPFLRMFLSSLFFAPKSFVSSIFLATASKSFSRWHFHTMHNGNFLWRMNDHARTQREIRRHSRVDAEATTNFPR
jgi:hypothetical protein